VRQLNVMKHSKLLVMQLAYNALSIKNNKEDKQEWKNMVLDKNVDQINVPQYRRF